jgi:hypothetical protein
MIRAVRYFLPFANPPRIMAQPTSPPDGKKQPPVTGTMAARFACSHRPADTPACWPPRSSGHQADSAVKPGDKQSLPPVLLLIRGALAAHIKRI